MSPTLGRLAAALTCAAGLAVAATPAGAFTTSPIPNYPNPAFNPTPNLPVVRAVDSTASPIPNYPNPQFDPTPDFPVVRTPDGTIVPIPNYPNPPFDPQS
jgi:hypothetical protein